MASNVYPWQALCQRTGGTLLVIPRPRDFDWTSAVLRAILENHGKVRARPRPRLSNPKRRGGRRHSPLRFQGVT